MRWPRPRVSLASMTLLVATAASALGLVAAIGRLDALGDEEPRHGLVLLGGTLVASIAAAGWMVAKRLAQGFERATIQVGLACLADLGLIRLLEWGGGPAFLVALGVILAVLLPAAALDLFRPRVAPPGSPTGPRLAAEVVACTYLVMVLGLFGTIPLGMLIGMAVELLWIFGRH